MDETFIITLCSSDPTKFGELRCVESNCWVLNNNEQMCYSLNYGNLFIPQNRLTTKQCSSYSHNKLLRTSKNHFYLSSQGPFLLWNCFLRKTFCSTRFSLQGLPERVPKNDGIYSSEIGFCGREKLVSDQNWNINEWPCFRRYSRD